MSARMTNEEFEGHLMSALVGPNGPAIAAKILSLLVANPTPESLSSVAKAVAHLHDTLVSELQGTVWELATLAHLDGIKDADDRGRRLNPRQIMNAVVHRERIRGKIRDRLRAMMRETDSGRAAASAVFLTLDAKEPSE
jgi:hypothetical protein